MFPLVKGILAFTLAGAVAAAQSNSMSTSPEPARTAAAKQPDKAELQRQIAAYENAARSGEAKHSDRMELAGIYRILGSLYADAGEYMKAEDAMKQAVADLKDGPQADLADELGQLGVVQVELGKAKQAEQDEMAALQIRESLGDLVLTAFTWNDLAGTYSVQLKFKKAVEYAQKAYDVLGNRAELSVDDRIAVRQTLGYGLTGMNHCSQGIPVLKEAFELAKNSYGDHNPRVGYTEYVLGFGYWHCGDTEHAAAWLEHGTTDMKADYGWDRSLYLNAMKQYARFLRTTGLLAQAASAEAVVNQADAVVDVRSLTGRGEGFRSAGSK